MKTLLLLNILLIIGAVLAAKTELEDDSGEETTTIVNNNRQQEKEEENFNLNKEDDKTDVSDKKKKPVSIFYGHQSQSVFNSNGNSIVVSSRFDSNGREEKYISIGSPKIRIDGEYFSCASLACPEEAFKCHVTSEAIADDRNNMKTKAECLDKDGKVLSDKEFTETNPHPTAEPPFSRVANVDRNGGIEIEDSTGKNSFNVKKLSKEEQEALNKELQEQNRRMNDLFAHQQRVFQQQMDELNRQLQATFSGPNFPFGNYNPFRPSYGFNSFPFGSNWPFSSHFGIRNSFPFGSNDNIFRDDVNFDTIEVNRPTNTLFVETSNPNIPSSFYPNAPTPNYNNPHNPQSINPFMPHPNRPSKEIETEFDDSSESDNEILDNPTNRIMVNNLYNRNNEKYRYAHGY